MNRKEEIQKKVEEALEGFAAVSPVEPAPFFYTRVRARLEKEMTLSWWDKIGVTLSRPVIAISALFLVVLINVSVVFFQQQKSSSKSATEQLAEDDYSSAIAVSFNYENSGQ
jgi:hypothetical protein